MASGGDGGTSSGGAVSGATAEGASGTGGASGSGSSNNAAFATHLDRSASTDVPSSAADSALFVRRSKVGAPGTSQSVMLPGTSAVATVASAVAGNRLPTLEQHPHYAAFRRIEAILREMVYGEDRVQIRNVKTLLTVTPSVVRGVDLVNWLVDHLKVDRMQALHVAHLMTIHGYVFPIDDHCLTVRNDTSLYRFQTPCLWLSVCLEPDDSEYAIYLCKRALADKQRLQLADYEAESLERLQRQLARKWDFICLQAEAQFRVDRKRPKNQQKILDGQERAFWDVFEPVPGCVKPMELDYRKNFRLVKLQRQLKTKEALEEERLARIKEEIAIIRRTLERTRSKVTKTFENLRTFTTVYAEYDGFVARIEPSNPWVSDSPDFWEQERADASAGNLSARRVHRWAFSIHELLRDPAGLEQFSRFLEKEFSAENLRFWRACQELQYLAVKDVRKKVEEIFREHLQPGCPDPVNIDSRVADLVRSRLSSQQFDRYVFDEAKDQIYNLMRNDSYNRFIRSDMYRELPAAKKKPNLMQSALRKVVSSSTLAMMRKPADQTRPLRASAPFFAELPEHPAGSPTHDAPPPRSVVRFSEPSTSTTPE